MPAFDAALQSGDVLHIWQKPIGGLPSSLVSVTSSGAPALLVNGLASDDFQMTALEVDGPVQLEWQDETTEVSLIYAYTPARVMSEGICILWTTSANRIDQKRNKLHLQPPFGWMNDPNGLCEINGITHAFYQHYPHSRRWNTMHWGHAVSQNLIDWTHLPVFLHPRAELLADKTKIGGAFSGTAVPMKDGSLRIFYTDREDDRLPNWEWQMTALSRDLSSTGPSEVLISERPPVPQFHKDMRDSYVFLGPDGLWKMLLGGGDDQGGVVLLYQAEQPEIAADWHFVGVLHRERLPSGIPLECPCMVALDGEGLGLHVLIFGMLGTRDETTRRRNLSYAIVGRFDGRKFEPIARREVDFGTDAYAFQAFQHHSGPMGIAWAANWTDVFKDRDFQSAMTFPRRLIWRNEALLMPPVESVANLRVRSLCDQVQMLNQSIRFEDGLAEILLDFSNPATAFKLDFTHPTHHVALVYDGETLELLFEPPGNRVIPRYLAKNVSLTQVRVFVDIGLIEIYVDDGRWCATKHFDSDEPMTQVRLETGPAAIREAHIWQLRPIKGAMDLTPKTRAVGLAI